MRRYETSLPASVRTLRLAWLSPTAKMTTSICSWNIPRRWRFLNWSIASKACPHVGLECCIPRSPSGITKVSYGPQAILLPRVVEPLCPSCGSTWKTKDKTCERFALSAFYLRPQTAELYGTCGKLRAAPRPCSAGSCLLPAMGTAYNTPVADKEITSPSRKNGVGISWRHPDWYL